MGKAVLSAYTALNVLVAGYINGSSTVKVVSH